MGCQDGKPLGEQPQPLLTPLFRIFAPPWAAPIKSEQIFFWGLQAPATGQLGGSSCLTQPSPRFQRSYRKNLRKLIIHQGC